jgi:hypothetical protein
MLDYDVYTVVYFHKALVHAKIGFHITCIGWKKNLGCTGYVLGYEVWENVTSLCEEEQKRMKNKEQDSWFQMFRTKVKKT